MTLQDTIEELRRRSARIIEGGGEAQVLRQHNAGKLTARERLDLLLDPGSFHETGRFARHSCHEFGMEKKEIPSDGVVTGYGLIDGRKVFVYAQDFTSAGGSMGKMQASKICRIMELAREEKAPVIGINDSGGARIQEGVDALSGYGDLFRNNVLCSGTVPQLTLIMGPCAGGAAYSPALTDLVLMTEKTAKMFCTGPAVLSSVTYEDVDEETLGGALTHASISGEVHLTAPDDRELLLKTRALLSYLPSSAEERPPVKPYTLSDEDRPALNTFLPDNERIPYDMKELIRLLADEDSFFELQPLFADNLITALIRIGGRVVGVVANQPIVMAGCLDINASDKGARFINFCNAFNIPLLSLVDVPGFLPGLTEEHSGILRHGAKMLYAFNTAEVPLITLLIRKAYGGAYIAMGSKECGADLVMAWPTAEIAVMGADGAVGIIFRKELKNAEDPAAERKRLADEYNRKFNAPYFAAGKGYIDMIIEPAQTRKELIAAFSLFSEKRIGAKHGNMPL